MPLWFINLDAFAVTVVDGLEVEDGDEEDGSDMLLLLRDIG